MDYQERYAKLITALNGDSRLVQDYFSSQIKPKNDFVAFVGDYMYNHGLQRSFVIREANLDPQYGYKLLNGSKHTHNRNIIIRICIAMRMDLEDTQNALRAYDMRLLDDVLFRDQIIIAGIISKKELDVIDNWLCKAGEKTLYDDCTI